MVIVVPPRCPGGPSYFILLVSLLLIPVVIRVAQCLAHTWLLSEHYLLKIFHCLIYKSNIYFFVESSNNMQISESMNVSLFPVFVVLLRVTMVVNSLV